MSALSWWRSWHGAPTDHKWPVIAARSGVKVGIVSAIAWALLDYASQQEERGSVAAFDPEEYAVYSGFSEDEIRAVIQAMTDKGIIVDGRLSNWEKRQPKREDDSNERVRKHRAMKRNVTHGNAPDKDTDTDKDTEKKEPAPAAHSETTSTTTTATAHFADDATAESIYIRVTGTLGIPVSQKDTAIDAIRSVRAQKNDDNETVIYLQKYWREWRERKYSPANVGWLDWALAGEAPTPRANGTGAPKTRTLTSPDGRTIEVRE